jgi:hypothetical protein
MVPLLFLILLWAGPAVAAPELCERAAAAAAAESGVPADLLLAIARAESGRPIDGQLRPWPWAANLGGRGYWFDNRPALVAFVEGAIAAGQTNIDIGCFQINWRWHGAGFAAPADVSDPLVAARHAARFLRQLHDELGGWDRATGAYHSRDPDRAARYAARVAALRRPPAPEADVPPAPAARRPRGPSALVAGGAPAHPGSLVPLTSAARPFLTGLAR